MLKAEGTKVSFDEMAPGNRFELCGQRPHNWGCVMGPAAPANMSMGVVDLPRRQCPQIRESLSPELPTMSADIPGDQPPIGTRRNHELVEFALADRSNQLFVSRYQVRLPEKREMEEFLARAVEESGASNG